MGQGSKQIQVGTEPNMARAKRDWEKGSKSKSKRLGHEKMESRLSRKTYAKVVQ